MRSTIGRSRGLAMVEIVAHLSVVCPSDTDSGRIGTLECSLRTHGLAGIDAFRLMAREMLGPSTGNRPDSRNVTDTMNKTLLVTLIALVLLAAACGDDDTEPTQTTDGDPFGDTTWVLTDSEVDGSPLTLLDENPITIARTDDGIGGTAACNSYGGGATIDGSSIDITELFQTEMACEPEVMDLETAYTSALGRVDTIAVDAETLTLTGEGVSLTFAARPDEPDAPLVGTVWMLDTIIDGSSASTPIAGSDPTLTIADDGTVSGTTGCNSLTGSIPFDDTTFEPAPLGSTRMACEPDLMDQEATVLRVLGDGPSWVIDGPLLTLTLDDGTALVYRAG